MTIPRNSGWGHCALAKSRFQLRAVAVGDFFPFGDDENQAHLIYTKHQNFVSSFKEQIVPKIPDLKRKCFNEFIKKPSSEIEMREAYFLIKRTETFLWSCSAIEQRHLNDRSVESIETALLHLKLNISDFNSIIPKLTFLQKNCHKKIFQNENPEIHIQILFLVNGLSLLFNQFSSLGPPKKL